MTALDITAAAGEIDSAVRVAGTPDRAEHEKRYLRSELVHYGAPVGVMRDVVRRLLRQHRPDRADAIALALHLWDWRLDGDPVHERRLTAALVLVRSAGLLEAADLAVLERLIREARTWALVDPLAVEAVGPLTDRLGATATPVLDRWAGDPDFWVRRSALLAHELPLRTGGGDWARFTRYADQMLQEREFFVRKAIGWVLRDTARRRPELVAEWILPRAGRASGVTLREVVKPLPSDVAAQIMTAYRDGSAWLRSRPRA